jgi:hypothetical protein
LQIQVESFKKSFADGMILCALIHKYRPNVINWNSLSRERPLENLQLAIDAASKFFDLEKYVSPEDILNLDENAMMVYVSDYYYGISSLRKRDLAGRNIAKVIQFTKENDAKRSEYLAKAKNLVKLIEKAKSQLEDRTIDNTMAGARNRLAEFNNYKANAKNQILAEQLMLEGIFNNLALRLAQKKRPEFTPPPQFSLKFFKDSIIYLEKIEAERNVSLHAELNRQVKLKKIDEEKHFKVYEKLKHWALEKETYLRQPEAVASISEAKLQLMLLEAYHKEKQSITNHSLRSLRLFGEELRREKYEKIDIITSQATEIEKHWALLDELSSAKKPVLEVAFHFSFFSFLSWSSNKKRVVFRIIWSASSTKRKWVFSTCSTSTSTSTSKRTSARRRCT